VGVFLITIILCFLLFVFDNLDKARTERRIATEEREKIEKLKNECEAGPADEESKEFAQNVVTGLITSFKEKEVQEDKATENTNEKEEDMALTQENLNFTINLKGLIRAALNDPTCALEVQQAIMEGPATVSTPLGSTSTPAVEGEEPVWFSLFVGTSRDVQPGQQGYISRTKKGDRIVARLRRQVKAHAAQNNASQPVQSVQAELVNQILAGDPKAAQAILDALADANVDNNTAEVYK
jgi:hypothetical protein